MKKGRSRKTYQCEEMVDNVYQLLVNDLMPGRANWFGFRDYSGPSYLRASPYLFKKHAQLEHFYKRVITSRDRSFDELKIESFEDFINSQANYGVPQVLTRRATMVLERARNIIEGILGEFDYLEFSKHCAFGKKAAKNLPFAKSYLDVRVRTLNGTQSQIEWFKFVLGEDIHLNRACRRYIKKSCIVSVIDLKAVPKTFKSARTMAPDTVCGGFLSRGLGSYFRAKLERGTRINLATQQEWHKILASKASISLFWATLDMSKASDSFVRDHLVSLLPPSWLPAIDVCSPQFIQVGNQTIEAKSVMLMGSGHTFPLQTLLFYALTKAVNELSGSELPVHVYGDDIITCRKYSERVIVCLEELGFRINREKSFFGEDHFRESCGGDYHTGVDVRPFMPELDCTVPLSKNGYVALLHKMANGLLERWDYEEIPQSYDYIMAELLKLRRQLNVVPNFEGPEAGLKFVPPVFRSFAVLPQQVWVPFTGIPGTMWYWKLVPRNRRRRPSCERAYYWYSLSPSRVTDPYDDDSSSRLDRRGEESMKGSQQYGWIASPY